MIEKILKAKHWQIFVAIIGLPLLAELILLPSLIACDKPGYMIAIMPFIMFLFVGGLFVWLWSVAIGLQERIPTGIKMKVKKFKIFLAIPLIYIALVTIFVSIGSIQYGIELTDAMVGTIIAIIVTLHLLSMFGIFYALYFAAKTFKSVELQREVTFSEFAGEFFLFWIFPIGIWIVQPKINNMIVD